MPKIEEEKIKRNLLTSLEIRNQIVNEICYNFLSLLFHKNNLLIERII